MNTSWIQNIIDTVFGAFLIPTESMFLEIFDIVFFFISNGTSGIFYDQTVLGILNLTTKLSFVVLIFSIPFYLKDIYIQADNIDYKEVIISAINGYLFSRLSITIGVSFFRYSNYILSLIGLSIDSTQIKNDIFSVLGISGSINFIVKIIIVIAAIFFFIELVKSTSSMLIHLLATPLYVPYIIRGDRQKLSEWITQAVSICATYFIQYFVFYVSVYFLLSDKYMLAFVFFTAALIAKTALKSYGYLNGNGGLRNSISVSQSAIAAFRGLHTIMS